MAGLDNYQGFKELVTGSWIRWVQNVQLHSIGCIETCPTFKGEPVVYESVVCYWSDSIDPKYRYKFFFFDFDNTVSLEYARHDAEMFVEQLVQVYEIDPAMLGIFFSGMKGFHVLIPAGACVIGDWYECNEAKQPTIKTFANAIAGGLSSWDRSVYDSRRVMRVANTQHQTSGLYKVPISYTELQKSEDDIKKLATHRRDLDDFITEWHGAPPLVEIFTQCEVLQQQVAPRTARGGALRDYFLPAKKGERNTSASKLAGLLRKAEVNLELAQMITAMWNRQNDEPLDAEELSRIVHRIYKRY